MAKKTNKHSGFYGPTIGTAYQRGPTIKRLPGGTTKGCQAKKED